LKLYKRSIFLVNPRFQLKFSFLIVFLVWLSSSIYPFLIMDFFDNFSRSYPASQEVIANVREDLQFFLMGYHVIYAFIVFLICVYLTFKIAGPMYKLVNYLRSIALGENPTSIFFRSGDYFPEVAEEVNNAFDKIKETQQEHYEYLSEVKSYINNLALVIPDDKKPIIDEINHRLDEIKKRIEDNS
jgi:signal transduction histidine kinase